MSAMTGGEPVGAMDTECSISRCGKPSAYVRDPLGNGVLGGST
jgi:hypothetical protein